MSARGAFERARTAFWLRGCEKVGVGVRLHGRPTVEVYGGHIRIGDRFQLASRPVASHLVVGPEGVLEIGHDVSIGHGAAVAAFERIQIRDGARIGPFVIIMDTNFHGAPGDLSVQHDCRPVTVGRHCRIGSRVTITRGASIGDEAEILAGSVVASTIPPGVCAGGALARIVGRAGDAASRWDGTAAALPDLVMGVFDLEMPPDLASDPSSVPRWDDRGAERLGTAIEHQFGVWLDWTVLERARSFADIAAAVERVRRERGDCDA